MISFATRELVCKACFFYTLYKIDRKYGKNCVKLYYRVNKIFRHIRAISGFNIFYNSLTQDKTHAVMMAVLISQLFNETAANLGASFCH